ncbi:MAG: KTSC domain-containing protein [Devosia sp.]
MAWFDSEAIARAEYDGEDATLFIWFRGNERPYAYCAVPEEIFHALCDAESKGRFVQEHIIDRYQYAPP